MKSFLSIDRDLRRPFWLAILIVSNIAFTMSFACAVPFAAFAAATALTLSQRDAIILMLGVWLTNQIIGFMFMDYPLDINSFSWGAALGLISIVSLFSANAAAILFNKLHPLLNTTLAFIVAFMTYEAACYFFALILGGAENFTIATQSYIFILNISALIGLLFLNRLGSLLHFVPIYVNSFKPARSL